MKLVYTKNQKYYYLLDILFKNKEYVSAYMLSRQLKISGRPFSKNYHGIVDRNLLRKRIVYKEISKYFKPFILKKLGIACKGYKLNLDIINIEVLL